SSTRHVSLDYKAMLQTCQWTPKTFQDAMDPFTKQGNCPRTLIRKSPYTKAGHFLGSQCPDLISRGNLFGAIPATVPFIIQQSCVFNVSLDNRGPFQDDNAVF
ncbi:hypothetical protein TNCT_602631, partial [Trichonephila clavata]